MTDKAALRDLMRIPGVGKSIAQDLVNIGIYSVQELVGRDPEEIYATSNAWVGMRQDPCLLYVFRCAVYFAETPPADRSPDKLLWWNWKGVPYINKEAR